MNENIMENNETMEVAEEMVTSGTGLGLKLGVGALILGGAIYGGMKLYKKIKAKREDGIIVVSDEDIEVECEDEGKNTKKK